MSLQDHRDGISLNRCVPHESMQWNVIVKQDILVVGTTTGTHRTRCRCGDTSALFDSCVVRRAACHDMTVVGSAARECFMFDVIRVQSGRRLAGAPLPRDPSNWRRRRVALAQSRLPSSSKTNRPSCVNNHTHMHAGPRRLSSLDFMSSHTRSSLVVDLPRLASDMRLC